MGFSLGASIAAKLAESEAQVILDCGRRRILYADGGILRRQ